MNAQRVAELLYYTICHSPSSAAIEQAMPDRRLTNPVGDFGFPGREISPSHGQLAIRAMEMSGVR